MRSWHINGERLLDDLNHLSSFGALPKGGIDRPAFSPACSDASRWLVERMKEAGLSARIDAAGNVIGRLGPGDGGAILIGSHIDTVPGGGPLDGSLGVIAGLECLRSLAESGANLDRAVEVAAFADEEGAYLSMLGSRAMTGTLTQEEVDAARGRRGDRLADAMAAAGLDIGKLAEAERPRQSMTNYLELHIEQGPVLESRGLDVGIVDSIIGIDVAEYTLFGQARHAGTTPMGERRDAGRAAAEAIVHAFDDLDLRAVPEARITFGDIEIRPGASNVVPGQARILSEIRAIRLQDMRQIRQGVDSAFDSAAARHTVRLDKRALSGDVPSAMAPDMIDLIGQVCIDLDHKFMVMPSGASHDASNFAALVPSGMIFVASRGGVSHHPDEYSEPKALVTGTNVLFETVRRLLTRTIGGNP
ncbi:MAG: Zn-dependent hydrolase [Pseudomonadota bacterium]